MNRKLKKKTRKSNSVKVFYSIVILSILVFIIGLIIDPSLSEKIGSFIGATGDFSFDDYLIFIPFCIWAWLIIIGIIFIRKNWMIILTLLALLIPHIIVIMVTFAYSHGLLYILKMYLYILSFGIIKK